MNLDRYIGIPFKSHGRDFNGVDCYGLVRLFLKNELSKDLPDFWEYNEANDLVSVSRLVTENVPLVLADKKESPDIGDIVLYKFRGFTSHVAVYVGRGRVLHVLKGINSCCVPMEHGILRGRVYGIYGTKQDNSSSDGQSFLDRETGSNN